jgi:hypothetical protein
MAGDSKPTGRDDALLRSLRIPEEQRRSVTATPWRGEPRVFSSPNVVMLEDHRSEADWSRIVAGLVERGVLR